MTDLVSIIMPNYNCGKYLEETILSVVNQTYTNWELLIVDDCSTDNSIDIIKKFVDNDCRIKLYVNETNQGAAFSRNLALREAAGRYMAFLDSDDLWLPEKLEKQIKFMEDNGYKFSCTEYEQIDEQSILINRIITGPKKITKHKLFCYNYIGCLTAMYDASQIPVMQIKDIIGNGRNDYALWLKVIKYYNCYLLGDVLARYRIRNKSLSHSGKTALIKTHYKVFRVSEERSVFVSVLFTLRNLFYGVLKRIKYVRKA